MDSMLINSFYYKLRVLQICKLFVEIVDGHLPIRIFLDMCGNSCAVDNFYRKRIKYFHISKYKLLVFVTALFKFH